MGGAARGQGQLFSALATAGMMYVLISSPADPMIFGILLFATGVFLSIGYSAYMVYPMSFISKPTFPIANAIVNTVGQAGGASAPLIAGLMLDAYGWNAVFLVMGFGSLLTFLIVSTIREPLAK